jgi:phosphoenolpyruvate carboxylase
MSEIAALSQRLQDLHATTEETPLFNPVFPAGA